MSSQQLMVPSGLPLEIIPDLTNPNDRVAKVGERLVPLVTSLINVQLIQPGHVQKDKTLAASVGKFMVAEFGNMTFDDLFLVPIGTINRARRMYAGEYKQGVDNKVICYSVDGLKPSTKLEAPMSPECGAVCTTDGKTKFELKCQYAQWVDGKKPACGDVVNIAMLDIVHGAPLRFQLHGKGISAWNKFLRDSEKMRNASRLLNRDTRGMAVRLSSENEGTFVSFKWELVDVPDKNPGDFLALSSYYADTLVARWAKEESSRMESTPTSAAATASEDDGDIVPAGTGMDETAGEAFKL